MINKVLLAVGLWALNGQAGPCTSLVEKAKGEYNNEKYEVSYKTSQKAIQACEIEKVRSAPAHVLAGASQLRLGNYQKAVNEFLIAEKIDPKSETIQKNLCSAYGMLKDEKNSDKYCGINQPLPKEAPKKNCHYPNKLDELKVRWSEGFSNCKNKPVLNLQLSTGMCTNNYGAKGGGVYHYELVHRMMDILDDVCAEKPEAFKRIKTITLLEVPNFESQNIKDAKASLEAHLLLGRWNERLISDKVIETQDKMKQDLRRIFGVKLQTIEEKNQEENAKLNVGYDQYTNKHAELSKKQKALIDQKNKVSENLGVGIGKIWSSPGDPTKKAAEAEAFQKKSDAEIASLDKQIEAIHQQLEKLTADHEKNQGK